MIEKLVQKVLTIDPEDSFLDHMMLIDITTIQRLDIDHTTVGAIMVEDIRVEDTEVVDILDDVIVVPAIGENTGDNRV